MITHRRAGRVNAWEESQGKLGTSVRVDLDAQSNCMWETFLHKRGQFLWISNCHHLQGR